MQQPKEGEEKNCRKCGQPATFSTRRQASKPGFQVGDYVPPAAKFENTPGWTCTVCNDFEPWKP